MSPPDTHKNGPRCGDVRWSTVLHPYRSADKTPMMIIAALIGGGCFVAGVAFSTMGAWPVFGFLGLDILFLVFAIRLNLRRARTMEALTLTPRELKIERIDPWGKRQEWSVPPHWLRVIVTDGDRRQPRLELHTHGRIWTIAQFLHPEQKERLAAEIRDALKTLGPPPADERSFEG